LIYIKLNGYPQVPLLFHETLDKLIQSMVELREALSKHETNDQTYYDMAVEMAIYKKIVRKVNDIAAGEVIPMELGLNIADLQSVKPTPKVELSKHFDPRRSHIDRNIEVLRSIYLVVTALPVDLLFPGKWTESTADRLTPLEVQKYRKRYSKRYMVNFLRHNHTGYDRKCWIEGRWQLSAFVEANKWIAKNYPELADEALRQIDEKSTVYPPR
jgi:hypothetical protein